ncbi:MAG: hypothetical protein M8862_10885, partial [marine benthic group bacterium]|nr:hypothetical protein [Gemmatimonadota bacterium]
MRPVVLDLGARFGVLFGTLRVLGLDLALGVERVDGIERGTERFVVPARGTERGTERFVVPARGTERGTVLVPVSARGAERGSTRVRAAVPGLSVLARARAARSAMSDARV